MYDRPRDPVHGLTLDASLEFRCGLGPQRDRKVKNVNRKRSPNSVQVEAHRVKHTVGCPSCLQELRMRNFGKKARALECLTY
jgi:hypothetical protein